MVLSVVRECMDSRNKSGANLECMDSRNKSGANLECMDSRNKSGANLDSDESSSTITKRDTRATMHDIGDKWCNINKLNSAFESIGQYSCQVINCNASFSSEQDLMEHNMSFLHSPCNQLLDDLRSPFIPCCYMCPQCDEQFRTGFKCLNHMLDHLRLPFYSPLTISAFMCPQCLHLFRDMEPCTEHMDKMSHHKEHFAFHNDKGESSEKHKESSAYSVKQEESLPISEELSYILKHGSNLLLHVLGLHRRVTNKFGKRDRQRMIQIRQDLMKQGLMIQSESHGTSNQGNQHSIADRFYDFGASKSEQSALRTRENHLSQTMLNCLKAVAKSSHIPFLISTEHTESLPFSKKDTETLPSSKKDTETLHSSKKDTETLPSSEKHTKTLPSSKKDTETLPSSEKHTEILPSSEKHTETLPSGEKRTEALPSSEKHTETLPSSEKHTEILPSSEKHTETLPSGEKRTEALPSSEKHTETLPFSEKHTETLPSGEKRTEALPSSEKHTETLPSGEKRTEALPSSENHKDTLPSSEKHTETLPSSKKHTEALPFSEKHTETLPFSEKHTETLPFSEKHTETLSRDELMKQRLMIQSGSQLETAGSLIIQGVFSKCFLQKEMQVDVLESSIKSNFISPGCTEVKEVSGKRSSPGCTEVKEVSGKRSSPGCTEVKEVSGKRSSPGCTEVKEVSGKRSSPGCTEVKEVSGKRSSPGCTEVKEVSGKRSFQEMSHNKQEFSSCMGNSQPQQEVLNVSSSDISSVNCWEIPLPGEKKKRSHRQRWREKQKDIVLNLSNNSLNCHEKEMGEKGKDEQSLDLVNRISMSAVTESSSNVGSRQSCAPKISAKSDIIRGSPKRTTVSVISALSGSMNSSLRKDKSLCSGSIALPNTGPSKIISRKTMFTDNHFDHKLSHAAPYRRRTRKRKLEMAFQQEIYNIRADTRSHYIQQGTSKQCDVPGTSTQGNQYDTSNQLNVPGTSNQGNQYGTSNQLNVPGTSNQGNQYGTSNQLNVPGTSNQGNQYGTSNQLNVPGTSNQGNQYCTSNQLNVPGTSNQGNQYGTSNQLIVPGTSNQGNQYGTSNQLNGPGTCNQDNQHSISDRLYKLGASKSEQSALRTRENHLSQNMLNCLKTVAKSSPTPYLISTEYLQTMKNIVFLDLDNWGGFFKKLPRSLPRGTFVWGFYGGDCKWTPPEGSIVYHMMNKKGMFYLNDRCGTTKDATDFAIVLTVGKMNERLPVNVAFTILSGDKGFYEVERQMKDSLRRVKVIDPHDAAKISNHMIYAMVTSVTQT